MTNKINISLVIVALALFLVPAISFGQADVDAGLDADAEVDATTTNTDVDSEADVDAGVDADVDNESDTEAESSSEGNLRANPAGVNVTLPSQVNSEADLGIFSENTSMSNNAVASVDISSDDDDNRVSVTYNHRARFLGFIPVTLKSTTRVEARANGEVEVRSRLPWWSFMASGTSDIKSSIESRVSNNSQVRANASVDASASSRARVAQAIIAELDARASTEANASTNN